MWRNIKEKECGKEQKKARSLMQEPHIDSFWRA